VLLALFIFLHAVLSNWLMHYMCNHDVWTP